MMVTATNCIPYIPALAMVLVGAAIGVIFERIGTAQERGWPHLLCGYVGGGDCNVV